MASATPGPPTRPHLDSVQRRGRDVREGRDIDSEDFIAEFGFRGVEFGNWVASDERQTSVNMAFEALHDLADVLGVPPDTLSLGGQLGIAFGARGKGAAKAHYEPDRLVINMTKLSGAGSLAHEWGHALDHYFGQLDREAKGREAWMFVSGSQPGGQGVASGIEARTHALRPEVARAWDGVMQALFHRQVDAAEAIRDLELAVEQEQAKIDRQKNVIETTRASYERAKEQGPVHSVGQRRFDQFIKKANAFIAYQEKRIKALRDKIALTREHGVGPYPATKESRYAREAAKLSGKSGSSGYWARPTEMFARAFESFVLDRVAETEGNISQYLVQGVEESRFASDRFAGNPYPTGDERQAINAAIGKLVDSLQVREREGRRELFNVRREGAEPVATLSGDEFGEAGTSTKDLRAAAQNFYTQSLAGTTEISEALGRPVHFGSSRKAFSTSADPVKIKAFAALREIIRKSVKVGEAPPANDAKAVKAWHYLEAPVRIGGETYTFRVSVREDNNGDFYYNHVRWNDATNEAYRSASEAGGTPVDGKANIANDTLNVDIATAPEGGPLDAAAIAGIRETLAARLKALKLDDKVALKVEAALRSLATGERLTGVDGSYYERLIQVSYQAPDAVWTLNHEVIHALRDLGLLKSAEWTSLKNAALADKAGMAEVRQRYKGQGLTEEQLIEELVADRFADWHRGRAEKGFARDAFSRIREFLQALYSALAGNGFLTVEQVYRGIESGRVGARGEAATDGAGQRRNVRREDTARKLADAGIEGVEVVGDGPFGPVLAGLEGRWADTVAALQVLQTGEAQAVLLHPDVPGAIDVIYGSKAGGLQHILAKHPEIGKDFDNDLLNMRLRERKGNRIWLESETSGAVVALDYEGERKTWLLTAFGRPGSDTIRSASVHGQTAQSSGRSDTAAIDASRVAATLNLYARNAPQGEANIVEKPAGDKERYNIRRDERRGGNLFSGTSPMSAEMPHSIGEALTDANLSLAGKLRHAGNRDAVAKSWEGWRTSVQDRFLPLLRAEAMIEQATGKPLPANARAYRGEELMTGKIGWQMERLTEDMVAPLLDDMQARKVTIDEFETYLYARHAPERNAQIAKINPEFSDGEGSGMTDAEAAAIMETVEDSGRKADFDALAAQLDAILKFALDTRVKAGLLSKAEAAQWRKTYKHYVPLRGEAGVDPEVEALRPRRGSEINIRGSESRRAFGRKSRASDIFANALMQAQEAIYRAETNAVAQRFVELARAMPDPDFWAVNKVTRKAYWDKAAGQVRYRAESRLLAEDAQYTVSAKIDGEEVRVTLNRKNERAVKLATAMRNLKAQEMNWVVRTFGSINRFLSNVNTSWNPEFVISNAIRDLQEAAVIGSQHDTGKLISRMVKDWPKAMKGAFKASFDKNAKGEWAGWYRRFSAAGGRVYFNQVEDIDAIRRRIDRALAKNDRLSLSVVGERAIHLIERTNLAVENAIRVSFFKNAIEVAGMSEEEAAAAAKNLTVNFNKRGERGALINSFYLFFNAGIQGQANLLLAAGRSPRVRKLLGGMVLLGLTVELLNAMISGEDDDGEKHYDKISDFDKQRNLIIMLPDGKSHVKLMTGYGISSFPALGRAIGEILRGKSPTEAGANLLEAIIDSWNPIGGDNNIVNFLAPTAADWIVDLSRNRDFADRPIMPDEKQYGPKVPNNQRHWDSVGKHWKAVTDFLNRTTGGDEVRPGAIDISPEVLEYMFGVATGAAGATLDRFASIPGRVLDGELRANDIPFARRVIGSEPSWYGKATFYERAAQVEQAFDNYKKDRALGGDERAQQHADPELMRMRTATRNTRRVLANLRQQRARANKDMDGAGKRERLREIKEREQEAVTRFNRLWNAHIGRADGAKIDLQDAA